MVYRKEQSSRLYKREQRDSPKVPTICVPNRKQEAEGGAEWDRGHNAQEREGVEIPRARRNGKGLYR
jgi:hypothetical protein